METLLETAHEGNRFFDLRRWGELKDTLDDFLSRQTLEALYGSGENRVTSSEERAYLSLDVFYQHNPTMEPGKVFRDWGSSTR